MLEQRSVRARRASATVSARRAGARATVVIAGEYDLTGQAVLAGEVAALLDAGPVERVDLDASGVTFLDSTGMRSLLAMQAAFVEIGVDFRVAAASAPVRRLLELAGLTEVMLDGLRHLDV